jgi:class 3 adenylate cyclase
MEGPSCHTANSEAARTGAPGATALGAKCAACGLDSPPAARFCARCGTRLAAPLTSLRVQQPRQVTVLFSDIVDSTEQIAQLGPEQAMHRLQPAITLMCEAVERFGGTVMRTLGDGVMALFGAPAELDGHARLACESALHMQSEFARADCGLSIRVGLHSGHVACDPHRPDGRTRGLAHGLTIHLASRVQNLASPGGVVITHDCHSLVSGLVQVEPMGRRHLKGIPDPVEIFKLSGLAVSRGAAPLHAFACAPSSASDSAAAAAVISGDAQMRL